MTNVIKIDFKDQQENTKFLRELESSLMTESEVVKFTNQNKKRKKIYEVKEGKIIQFSDYHRKKSD